MCKVFEKSISGVGEVTSKNSEIIFICFAARFYFFKLSDSLEATKCKLKVISDIILSQTDNKMSEWIDLLNGFKGEKKMFFEKLQINNSKCKILNKKNLSMRTYQRLLETVSVDVKEIRYEGIKDFHKLAMNVNISQEKSMSVLSQVTGLSAKHINDVLNDSIQPTGNKHNDNSDIVNKIIKLYSAAKECQNDYIISNNIYKIEQINSKPNTIVFKYRENALKALKKMMQLKNS